MIAADVAETLEMQLLPPNSKNGNEVLFAMPKSLAVNGRHGRCTLAERHQCDDIVDVRTPAEFADDHIPGAINAPVLSNDERAWIGTMYKQESAFQATRLGAALAARHIARHMETLFADRPRGWQPLIYCWRGGKRSGAMATWFNLVGWRARQLEGGYKAWRHHVLAGLERLPAALRCIVLTGPTGSGKTRLLQALGQVGAQVLDLEALARHRGSLLGRLPAWPQPSQRGFETALYSALSALDTRRPVFVEAESRRIGRLDLPTNLLQAMHASRCVRIQADLAQRIDFLLQDYAHLFVESERFKRQLGRLAHLHSRKTVARWQAMIDANERAQLFQELVQIHYDPAYRRSSGKHYRQAAAAPVFAYDPTAADARAQACALLEKLDLRQVARKECP